MKKVIPFLAVAAVVLLLLPVPALAYDFPGTLLTPDMVGNAVSGLKSSVRAVVNVGLLIMGILLSVSMIFRIFSWLLSWFAPGFGRSQDQYRRPAPGGDFAGVESAFFGRGGKRK